MTGPIKVLKVGYYRGKDTSLPRIEDVRVGGTYDCYCMGKIVSAGVGLEGLF